METIENAQNLKTDSMRIVGTKRVLRALDAGKVKEAYIADDADLILTQRVVDRCYAQGIPCRHVATMKELGVQCGIEVKAAAACLLKEAQA